MKLTRQVLPRSSARRPPPRRWRCPAPARAAKPATRTLGRTKLAVSELGMGVMITPNPEVVRAALDAGVTYFDTARVYMGGRNEAILAEGLGTRRKEVVVATKCASYGSAASIVASCEQSLAALKTDWIDVYQLHGVSSRAQVLAPECLEGLAALKKAGKIRFAGVTTHAGMVEVIDAAVEAGVYDTVLTTYNFREPPGPRRGGAAGGRRRRRRDRDEDHGRRLPRRGRAGAQPVPGGAALGAQAAGGRDDDPEPRHVRAAQGEPRGGGGLLRRPRRARARAVRRRDRGPALPRLRRLRRAVPARARTSRRSCAR